MNSSEPDQSVPPAVGSTGNQRTVKNAAIYFTGQTLTWAITFVTVSIIPRHLGETAMGELSLATNLVAVLSSLFQFSIDKYLVAEIARDPERGKVLFNATLGLRLVALPLLLAATAVALYVTHATPSVRLIAYLLIAKTSILFLTGPVRSLLAAWEDAKRVSLLDFRMSLNPLIAIPFLNYGVVVLPFVALVTAILANISTTIWVRKRFRFRAVYDPVIWKVLLLGGAAFLMNDLVLQLSGFVSTYLLAYYTNTATVGVYSQAWRLQGTFLFVPTAIGAALLPSLARMAEADSDQFQKLQRQVLVALIVVGLPVAALLFFMAEPFCHLLYGTKQFQAMPAVLRVSAFNIVPVYITTVLYRFLIAQRKNGLWSCILLISVLVNSLLAVALIPWSIAVFGNGGIGSMLASVITETAATIVALRLLSGNTFTRDTIMRIAKALFATGVMSTVVWLTRDFFLLVPVGLGIVVYCLLAWYLRVLGAEEQQKLTALVRRKLKRKQG